MRAVNLLPSDATGDGRRTPPLPVLAGCVGVVLVTAVLALLFLSASSNVAKQRTALTQAQAEYAALPAPPPPSPVDSQLPQQRQTRVAALATALGQRVAWDRLLREISQVVPSDVWLLTLSAQAPALAGAAPPAPGTPPTGFTLSGCTYSQDSVARFLARLDVVPDLSSMTLGKSSSSAAAGGSSTGGSGAGAATDSGGCPSGMVTFTLSGNVRAAGATS
jgi:Tfp pilus assembly protein PilN